MDSVPENQCIVQFDLACAFLRGEVVEATLVDGSKYFGRFHACSSDADGLTVVLNYCSTTSRTAGDMDQVIIPGSQLMELQATDIAFNEITRSKQLYNSALATDAEIAQHAKSNGDKRELEMVSSDWLDGSEMDLEASARGAEKFDQFEVNKEKFGVHTEFNEEEYTTPLDVASFDAATVSRAHRTANEIENKQRLKKRGQRQLTEDELFSDVRAGPRTNTGNAWAKPVPLARTLGTKPANAAGKAGGSGGAYAPPFRRGADAPVSAKDHAAPAASAVARGATTEALREFSEKIDPAKVKGGQRISGGAKKPAAGAAPTAAAGTPAEPAAAATAVAPPAPPAPPAAKAQAVTDDAITTKAGSSGEQPTAATDPVKPAADAPAPAPKKLNPNAAEFRPTQPTSGPPAQAPGMPHPHSMAATGHAPPHMHMGMQQHQPGMRQPYWHPHHPPMYMPQQMMMQYPFHQPQHMMHGMHNQPQHMMQMPGAGGPGGHRGGGNAGGGRGRGGHRGGMRGSSGRGRGGGRGGGAAGHAGSPVPSVPASPAGSPGQA